MVYDTGTEEQQMVDRRQQRVDQSMLDNLLVLIHIDYPTHLCTLKQFGLRLSRMQQLLTAKTGYRDHLVVVKLSSLVALGQE